MKRRERELHAANISKDQCIAVLSHELRTPLTPALLLLDTLLEAEDFASGGVASDQLRDDLEMIRDNLLVESQLMDDLLDATRMGSGKFTIAPAPTNIHTTIRHAIKVVEHAALEKNIKFTLKLEAEKIEINADVRRMLQVFWNVCVCVWCH